MFNPQPPFARPVSFTTAASGTTTWSNPFRMPAGYNGVFSLKWAITGGGSITWKYSMCESRAGTYVLPTGAGSIATSATSVSGDAANGHDAASFTPIVAPWIKIGAWERGNDSTALTAWLIVG